MIAEKQLLESLTLASPWILLAAIFMTSVLAPVIIGLMSSRTSRKAQAADWARQDEVAKIAAVAAQAASDRAEKTARLLLESNERGARRGEGIIGQLTVIHDLVNSDKTERMQQLLESMQREHVLLLELVDLKRSNGHLPTPEALKAIGATAGKVDELAKELAARREQQAVIDSQKHMKGPTEAMVVKLAATIEPKPAA